MKCVLLIFQEVCKLKLINDKNKVYTKNQYKDIYLNVFTLKCECSLENNIKSFKSAIQW